MNRSKKTLIAILIIIAVIILAATIVFAFNNMLWFTIRPDAILIRDIDLSGDSLSINVALTDSGYSIADYEYRIADDNVIQIKFIGTMIGSLIRKKPLNPIIIDNVKSGYTVKVVEHF